MELKFIVTLSVLCQLGAAVMALRLIRVTGRQAAWLLISLGLFGMAIRRAMPLYGLYAGVSFSPLDPAFEAVGLVTSLCMLAGVAWIGPLFATIHSHAEKVRRSEEKYRQIVDTAEEGIWFIDEQATTSYVNRRLAEMLGATPAEMRGRPAAEFLEDTACLDVLRRLGTSDREKAERHDCRLRRKDGSRLWAIVSANALFDDAGKPFGALAMITDISDRKRMEREREVLIEELREALANVKTLKGLLPICAWCNRVRDDSGDWHPMEVYIKIHSDTSFSHGICPECRRKM